MSHDARYGSRPGGGPHERRNRRHHRFGGGRGGPRRDSRQSTGGFWGFIKKLFGMGGGSSASAPSQQRHSNGRTSAPRVPRNRTAPPMEVLTPRLYVGNLSYDASESDVFDLEGAQEVAKKLHDTDFMGRLLIVNGAKSTGERFGGGGRQDRPPRDERSERGSEFDYDRGPRNPSYD